LKVHKSFIGCSLEQTKESIVAILQEAGFPNPLNETEWILCSLKKITRGELLACEREIFISEEEGFLLESMVDRRLQHEPLQYIMGYEGFWGRDFLVGAGCLIPRPETELLVEEALSLFSGGCFLDWGTGSGCIAATILLERPDSRGIAADVSPQALFWAWRNLRNYHVLHRCLLWHTQIPEDIPISEGSLDIVISNPPYIPTAIIGNLMEEVSRYEPRNALDGGIDGLSFYYMLLAIAPQWLKRGGFVIVEVGDDQQAEHLASLSVDHLRFSHLKKDHNGLYRIAVWCRV